MVTASREHIIVAAVVSGGLLLSLAWVVFFRPRTAATRSAKSKQAPPDDDVEPIAHGPPAAAAHTPAAEAAAQAAAQQPQQLQSGGSVTVEDVNSDDSDSEQQHAQRAAAAVAANSSRSGSVQDVSSGGDGDSVAETVQPLLDDDSDPDSQANLKRSFEEATCTANVLFRRGEFKAAAERYTEALALCERIPGPEKRKVILYNNRAAMYEKAGDSARCLMDCSACLGLEPMHPLARLRRARIYELLGKDTEALTELCAHMLGQRAIWAQAQQMGKQALPPEAPPRLEEVMNKVASPEADAIMREKEAQGSAAYKTLCATSTYEVLKSFESYAELESSYGGEKTASTIQASTEALQSAESASERAMPLLERAQAYIAARDYDKAAEDIGAAHAIVESGEVDDMPVNVRAAIYAWHGTFLHLRNDLDGAVRAYEAATELDPRDPDVLIKLAGVAMDREDHDTAEKLFEKVMDADVKYATAYMFRAQVHVYRENLAAVVEDLNTCLQLNPAHTPAYVRLIQHHLQQARADLAAADIEAALKVSPEASDMLTAKAEITFQRAMIEQNPHLIQETMSLIERALRKDPRNAPAYLVKAAVCQCMEDKEATVAAYEKAVEVDPAFQPALMALGQIKVNLADSEEEAMQAVTIFDRAIDQTRDKTEVLDMCIMKQSALAKIRAAKVLGMTSLLL